MGQYIMLSRLTDLGRRTLKERPHRLEEVNQEIEAMGARLKHQFSTMGDYDFVSVLEAPDNKVTARIVVELGSRGTVQIKTLPAMAIGDFVNMLQGAPAAGD